MEAGLSLYKSDVVSVKVNGLQLTGEYQTWCFLPKKLGLASIPKVSYFLLFKWMYAMYSSGETKMLL